MEYHGFMQLLGRYPERSEAWKFLHASLLTTRLAHAAFHDLEAGPDGLRVVRRAIRRLGDLRDQRRLDQIVALADATASDWSANDALSGALMSYGVLLHERGHLDAAIDVCEMIIESPIDDATLRLTASYWRAFGLRELRKFGPAEDAYNSLKALAISLGERDMELQAELGLARILGQRDDFDGMETGIRRVVAVARSLGRREVEANAHIDLSYIAGKRNDYAAIIRHCDDATQCGMPALYEERCRLNMAFAYRHLNWIEDARCMATAIASQSPHETHRNEAILLLYDIAIEGRDVAAMRHYRDMLHRTLDTLTPDQRKEFDEHSAREGVLPFESPATRVLYPSRPTDADPDLVSIAERVLTLLSSASAA